MWTAACSPSPIRKARAPEFLPVAGAEPRPAKVRFYGLVTDWSGDGELSTFNNYHCELCKMGGDWRIARLKALPARFTVGAGGKS